MRILIASSYAPLKNGHGNELQVWHVVDQLKRLHEVSVVYFGEGAQVDGVDLRAVRPGPWKALDRATTLARGLVGMGVPALVAQMQAAGFGEAVEQEADRFKPDVLYVTTSQAAGVIDHVRNVPRVVNVIDNWAYMETGMLRSGVGRLQGLRQQARIRAIYRYEQRMLDRFASVITVSELDRAYMVDMGVTVPIHVVSNGVDTEFFHPRPADRPLPPAPTVTFHGIMSYVPNEGAAQRLVERVMPLVWRTHPDVTVQLVGRDPSPVVQALAGDRVQVTGEVEDIRPYLWDASACVFPIFAGSGVKNKLLEASSMAKPMVATVSAIGDLDLYDGSQVLVRDDDDGLAAGIIELLERPEEAQGFGASARQVVEEHHSWTEVGRRISAICADAVA